MRTILDTSVLLGPPPANVDGDELAICTVTLAELHFGVLVSKTPQVRAERLRRLTLIERSFDALPVDDAVSREYGRLAAAIVHSGRQPRSRALDLLIAATAVAHGARLCTRNMSDLSSLSDLVEVVPAE